MLDKIIQDLNNQPVNIVEDIFSYLSPFSAHQINIWGQDFATVEHAYQWSKIKTDLEKDKIKNAKSPLQAWSLAQEFKIDKVTQHNLSRDELVKIVRELFQAKYDQHEDIRIILDSTRERGIIKIFGKDSFWGSGEDGSGENMMGKIWIEIRDKS
jgi:N-glycosidase YbiA